MLRTENFGVAVIYTAILDTPRIQTDTGSLRYFVAEYLVPSGGNLGLAKLSNK